MGRLNLQPFLSDVDKLLDSLPHDELKGRLRAHARTLSADQRSEFLSVLSTPAGAALQMIDVTTDGTDGESLLTAIDEFTDTLASMAYVDRWGWDPDISDERNFADESWVGEMDALFERAAVAYLAGDYELATKAYHRLFEAFHLADEGVFSGPIALEEMVDTDLAEAKARYLNALYRTSLPNERAEAILDTIERLIFIGTSNLSLRDIVEAGEGPLPEFDPFLSQWIETLERKEPEGRVWQRRVSTLLQEAVEWRGGIEGLREMAKKRGNIDSTLYVSLVERYKERGDLQNATVFAQEGMDRAEDIHGKAELGDMLFHLARQLGDDELALDAAKCVWRTDPSWVRLGMVYSAADKMGCIGAVLMEEAEWVIQSSTFCHSGEPVGPFGFSQDLQCALHLLNGDIDRAVKAFQTAREVGWSYRGHCANVVLPYLLLAGAAQRELTSGSLIAEVWDELPCDYGGDWEVQRDLPDAQALILSAITVSECALDRSQREKLLKVAEDKVVERVRTIVDNKHRGAYHRAAKVVVALTEARVLAGEPAKGTDFVEKIRRAYPRHSAFQRELNDAIYRSSVLVR